jgi:hypothetical protein
LPFSRDLGGSCFLAEASSASHCGASTSINRTVSRPDCRAPAQGVILSSHGRIIGSRRFRWLDFLSQNLSQVIDCLRSFPQKGVVVGVPRQLHRGMSHDGRDHAVLVSPARYHGSGLTFYATNVVRLSPQLAALICSLSVYVGLASRQSCSVGWNRITSSIIHGP